jgi:hypothetical protein
MPDELPVVGSESLMAAKAHGTSATPVQDELRWGCDWKTADRICNFNRHYAEHAGYFRSTDLYRPPRTEPTLPTLKRGARTHARTTTSDTYAL